MVTYLTVVAGEIEVVERMVGRSIDDMLQSMASDHIGIMDLCLSQQQPGRSIMTYKDTPEVHCNKQTEVKHAVKWEQEYEQVVWD